MIIFLFLKKSIVDPVVAKLKSNYNMLYLFLKGRIPLLFYCVKHIHGQFKAYLKLRNIHFKQIPKKPSRLLGKTLRDILLNPFCFVSCRFLNL
jgi:hypothetical protein